MMAPTPSRMLIFSIDSKASEEEETWLLTISHKASKHSINAVFAFSSYNLPIPYLNPSNIINIYFCGAHTSFHPAGCIIKPFCTKEGDQVKSWIGIEWKEQSENGEWESDETEIKLENLSHPLSIVLGKTGWQGKGTGNVLRFTWQKLLRIMRLEFSRRHQSWQDLIEPSPFTTPWSTNKQRLLLLHHLVHVLLLLLFSFHFVLLLLLLAADWQTVKQTTHILAT